MARSIKSLKWHIWVPCSCIYRSYHSNQGQLGYPVCGREVDYTSPAVKDNIMHNSKLYKEHSELLTTMPLQSTKEGRLSVYDRIATLKDGEDGYCLELSEFAGLKMSYGHVPRGNSIVVITRISGNPCIIAANNGSFKGGTMYPITVKKHLRSQEIALRNGLPCIYLVDCGGAHLPLQVIFPSVRKASVVPSIKSQL